MKVTKHARKRIHEREGIGKSSAERKAGIVLQKGYRRQQTKGALRKILEKELEYKGTADEIRVYGDKIYIFCGEVLVTVLNLPPHIAHNLERYVNG